MQDTKPIAKFKAGPVTAALWQNEITVDGQTTTILKATVDRRYRDRSGSYKSTQSFSRQDIPLVMFTLWRAWEAMLEKQPEEQIADAIDGAARE